MTDHETRLNRAMSELEASGIKERNYAPPIYRLAKRLGFSPRPPHYMSFASATLLAGPAFGLVWGFFMWLLLWRAQGLPVGFAIGASVMAGVLFGLAMAAYYRFSASQAGLSRWDDL